MGNNGKFPESLSAQFTNSYAFFVLKERLPFIINRTIETLFKQEDKIGLILGTTARLEVKDVVNDLIKLKKEVLRNDPLKPLTLTFVDQDQWNKSLYDLTVQMMLPPTWYSAPVLFSECYMYRRIYEAFRRTVKLRDYDYFQKHKEDALLSSTESILMLGNHVKNILNDSHSEYQIRTHLVDLLKISLWSNKCDVEVPASGENSKQTNPLASLTGLQQYIVASDMDALINYIFQAKKANPLGLCIDIVLDNYGFELFCDFCLAHFLCVTKIAKQIRFYVKKMPWFVSGVTTVDFLSAIAALKNMVKPDDLCVNQLARIWYENVGDFTWTIESDIFWTYPYPYSEMKRYNIELYTKLSQADLIMFKGDLNYRKLTGDRMWNFSTPFDTALSGFNPSPLCVLRIMKSETIVGLVPGQARDISRVKKDWMINGNFAVIQFSRRGA